MNRTRLVLLLAVFTAIAASGEDRAAAIDEIFTPLVTDRSPGFAVLVRQNGRTVLERGYGVRELRDYAKIDAHTNFRLASFTKQFTAMSIMLLVHQGKLRYDTPLTEIFPDFPAYGKAITVRHLLTHTGGLPDYESVMDEVKDQHWSPAHQIQDEEVLELLKHQREPKFAAGTSWSYSNSGYVMLGLIAAKAAGEPFPQVLDHLIFQPLAMHDTVAYVAGKNSVSNRAYGHAKKDGQFRETDQSSTSATLGDGGVYSNLRDLSKWDAALESHRLLSAEEMKIALTPVKLADGSQTMWPTAPDDDNLHPGKPVSYGYGWFLDPENGRARMYHTGSTTGFRTVIERLTSGKLTVIVLCNRTDQESEKLASRVAAHYIQQ